MEADLQRKLEEASRGYLEAGRSWRRRGSGRPTSTGKLGEVEARVAAAAPKANEILAATYRTGGPVRTASVLLASGSAGGFVDRAASLRVVAARTERQLRELVALRGQLAAAKSAIDDEIKLQEQQLAVMAKRKPDAESALADYGGQPEPGPTQQAPTGPPPGRWAGRPPPPPGPPPAQPAPGNGVRAERCSVKDPTTNGCLTPRTLHALKQASPPGSPGSCRATAAGRTAANTRAAGRATSPPQRGLRRGGDRRRPGVRRQPGGVLRQQLATGSGCCT